jgi:6-phosphogluconolactonase/glucosamine-6-phosphate isomerase/deaminase
MPGRTEHGSAAGEPTAGEPTAGEPTVIVLPDPEAVALVAAVERHGRADLATTGGSTPAGIYHHLAAPPLRDRVPWDSVHIWFGDDRYVPRDHPLSNVLIADQVLLGGTTLAGQAGTGGSRIGDLGIDVEGGADPGVPLPLGRLHPFPCAEAIGRGLGPAWCAATYATEVRAALPPSAGSGWPVFDLVLVGIGPDGHVLSVFPGSPALTSHELALAIPAPTHVEPHVERVTLNPAILGTAREVLAIAHGAAKASILATVLGPERDPARWPAQLARHRGATWLLDVAAAAELPREVA